ncbi:PREDICTED: uncharacterized protein LOC108360812 [Rhagoletis zephyria]|uniref:uncharacterized protein LOC108360812 n=1 Tax=Rhagoletis zephyria TaxID=28612 RepID=UPI00081153D0|nr:PREDICTED: uncharacterized protein LOC108360812 [Rhagoletis zephyria]
MASNKKLELHCSPGTFRRVESAPDYRVQIASLHAGDEAYEEIIFTQGVASMASAAIDESPIVPKEEDMVFVPIQNSGGSSQEKKFSWLDAPTKLLLALVKELRPKVGKSANLRNKKQMWNTISNELCAKGHFYNAAQVEGKFFTLERRYKNVQLNNSQTGRGRQTCPYQAELDEIFKERASVHPECVIDNEVEVSAEADEVSEASPASPGINV